MNPTNEVLHQLKQQTMNKMGPQWCRNNRLNAPYVQNSYEKIGEEIIQVSTQENVFIFAPGASLTQYEGRINQIKGVVVATPTVVPWLLGQDVSIDYVVIADAHPSMSTLLEGYEGPIICPTTVDHSITKLPNKKYWVTLLLGASGMNSDPEFGWWNWVQNNTWSTENDGPLSGGVLSLGDVTNMAMQVSVYLMLDGKLKAKRVVLMGADRSYWNDLGRVPTKGTKPPTRPLDIDAVEWRGKQTNLRMVYYQRGTMMFLDAYHFPVYRMDEGIMTEIPRVTFDDVLANTYPEPLSHDEMHERCEAFHKEFFDNFGKLAQREDV